MASIVQRNNRYNVVYLYDDEATGKRKQKWESFKTIADAKRRKAEVEYRQELEPSPNLCVNCLQVELLITTPPGAPPVFWQSNAGDPVHRIPEVSDRSLC